jgi:hypothetical protein
VDPQHSRPATRPSIGAALTARGSAPTQHAIGNWREPTRNNRQTANRQKPELHGPFKIRASGYYRTSSPLTALSMIMRWISDVPSKIVKLMEVRQFPQVDGVLARRLSAPTQHRSTPGSGVKPDRVAKALS